MAGYTYAADDPVNDEDPTGDWSFGSVLHTVSNFVNTAAPIVDTVALATSWIPVVGEVTAGAAAAVNVAAVAVNTIQAGVDLYNGDYGGAYATADIAAKLRRVIIAVRFKASRPDQPTPQEIAVLRLAWEDAAPLAA